MKTADIIPGKSYWCEMFSDGVSIVKVVLVCEFKVIVKRGWSYRAVAPDWLLCEATTKEKPWWQFW